jgi:hypothetical protein
MIDSAEVQAQLGSSSRSSGGSSRNCSHRTEQQISQEKIEQTLMGESLVKVCSDLLAAHQRKCACALAGMVT